MSRTTVVVGFIPPTGGLPANREGGSARGGLCPASPQRLTALLPSSHLGLTAAARPSFFAYMPPTGGRRVELMLQDEKGKVLHLSEFQINQTGIVRVDLPSAAPELVVGQTYRWYLSVICDPMDSSASLHVGGWVQRVAMPDNLKQQLQKAPANEHPYIYGSAGLWHETLASLMELRQAQPGNANLQADWMSLLSLEGLDKIAQEPLAGRI
ncbi:MAG: DUF928 domain-containing protein [Gloeomargarita sp. HHBFW_bins_162]